LSTTPNGKDQNCIAAAPYHRRMRQTLSLKTLSDTHQPAAAAPFSPVTVLPDVPASVTFNSLLHPSINKPAENALTACRE